MIHTKKLLLTFLFLFSWGTGFLLIDAAKEYTKKEYTISKQNPAMQYLKQIGKIPPSTEQRDALIKYASALKGFDELFFKYKIWFSIGILVFYIALLLKASLRHEQNERNNRKRYD